MGSLCGSSQQTSTTQQNIDPTVRQYGVDTMNLASQLAAGYQPSGIGSMPLYQGQRVAGMSPMEQQAGRRIARGNPNPYAGQAQQALTQGMQGYGGSFGPSQQSLSMLNQGAQGTPQLLQQLIGASAQRYGGSFGTPDYGGNFDVQPFSMDAVKGIADPYVSALNDEVQRNADQSRNAIRTRASAAKAFGGDRAALMETENQGNADRLKNQNQSQAYQTAQQLLQANRQLELQQQLARSGQFNTDQGRNLQAQQLRAGQYNTEQGMGLNAGQSLASIFSGDQTRMGNIGQLLAQLGLQTQQLQSGQFNTDQARRMTGAGQLGSLGELIRSGNQQDISNMMNFGSTERGINQSGLDADYDQFQQALNYPQQMLNLRMSALNGMPTSQSTTTTQPGAGLLQQLLGTGIGAAGMGKMFGWWG